MPSPQSEAQFQKALLEAAELHGWKHCHIRRATVRQGRIATPTSVPGWPDLVLWRPGKGGVLFAELKRADGVVSPAQRKLLASLASAGANVCVWRPSMWPEINEVLKGGP